MAEEEKKPEEQTENVNQRAEASESQAEMAVQRPQGDPGKSAKAAPEGGGGVAEQKAEKQMAKPKGGGRRWTIILIVVLVIGITAVIVGFIAGKKAREAKLEKREERMVAEPTQVEDQMTAEYEQQSSTDEIADIEKDLQDTSFEGIDKELSDIDQELDASE